MFQCNLIIKKRKSQRFPFLLAGHLHIIHLETQLNNEEGVDT